MKELFINTRSSVGSDEGDVYTRRGGLTRDVVDTFISFEGRNIRQTPVEMGKVRPFQYLKIYE